MKGLQDLRPLTTAPSPEQLLLIDMPNLKVEDLESLKASRTLRQVRIGLGSMKRNQEAHTMFGLPDINLPPDNLFD